MNDEDWFGVVLRLLIVPAAVYWVLVNALHLGHDGRMFVASIASMGGMLWTAKRYG